MNTRLLTAILFLILTTGGMLPAQTATKYLPSPNRDAGVDLDALHQAGCSGVRIEEYRGEKIIDSRHWEIDAQGRVSRYGHTDHRMDEPVSETLQYIWQDGRLAGIKATYAMGSYQEAAENRLIYDNNGRLIRYSDRTDPDKDCTYRYDSRDSLVYMEQGPEIRHHFYYGGDGMLARDSMVASFSGAPVIHYTWDAQRRLISSTHRTDTEPPYTDEYTYDRASNLAGRTFIREGRVVRVDRHRFDRENREVKRISRMYLDSNSRKPTSTLMVGTVYGAGGRIYKVESKEKPAGRHTVQTFRYSEDGRRTDWETLDQRSGEVVAEGYTLRNAQDFPLEEVARYGGSKPMRTRYTYFSREAK